MRKIICFGEAIIDFLNTGTQNDGELTLNTFTQFPGGAPANVAVAIAKLGGDSIFMGQVGNDPFGDFLIQALKTYGVDTRLTFQHPTAATPLAYVFLDKVGERSFSFRRNQTADLIFSKNQVEQNVFTENSILHYCSNTLTESNIAGVSKYVVSLAKKQNALISFDVNLRDELWDGGRVNRQLVNEFVYQSNLVKFAKEELTFLSDGNIEQYLEGCFERGVKTILVTDGGNAILLITPSGTDKIQPPCVKVIDTTGGGDAFIGALLFGLSRTKYPMKSIGDISLLKKLTEFASQCGAHAVSKQGAFPAFPSFDEVKHTSIVEL